VGLVETWVEERNWKKIKKYATKRVEMGRPMGKKRKEKGKSCRENNNGVKLGIKVKRQEKGEEEGYMETNVQIGNIWWKIMTIYNKEVKTARRHVEDAMKENGEECIIMGGDFYGRIGEREPINWEEERGMGKENPKTRWKMQWGRD
jgi:hypothetical protein